MNKAQQIVLLDSMQRVANAGADAVRQLGFAQSALVLIQKALADGDLTAAQTLRMIDVYVDTALHQIGTGE
jgi:hypothetical protein